MADGRYLGIPSGFLNPLGMPTDFLVGFGNFPAALLYPFSSAQQLFNSL
jgi:hypothetical protein